MLPPLATIFSSPPGVPLSHIQSTSASLEWLENPGEMPDASRGVGAADCADTQVIYIYIYFRDEVKLAQLVTRQQISLFVVFVCIDTSSKPRWWKGMQCFRDALELLDIFFRIWRQILAEVAATHELCINDDYCFYHLKQ